MFLAYLGIALAAKYAAPRPALGTLIIAALLCDSVAAIAPVFPVPVPFTGTPAGCLAWGIVFGSVYFWKRADWRGALTLALVVVSHGLVDALSPQPAMLDERLPGAMPPLALAFEAALFAAGVQVYRATTKATDWNGNWIFRWFVVAACGVFALEAFLPAAAHVLRIGGIGGWMFVAWGYWIEKHREPVPVPAAPS